MRIRLGQIDTVEEAVQALRDLADGIEEDFDSVVSERDEAKGQVEELQSDLAAANARVAELESGE